MVIIDTSIIIEHLRGSGDTSFLQKLLDQVSSHNLGVPIIVIQELYVGQSTKNSKKEKMLIEVLSNLRILPYTYEIAKLAGEIDRDLKRPIKLADSAIAATAIVHNAPIATLNRKDFEAIKNVVLLELYD